MKSGGKREGWEWCEEGRVPDLDNFLCRNGPDDGLHWAGITTALEGKLGHEAVVQLIHLQDNPE